MRVIYFGSFIILLAVHSHGRITPTEHSNVVDNQNVESKTDYVALSKALFEISDKPTTQKPCLQHGVDPSDNEIESDDNDPCKVKDNVDNGTALLLTPYIEEGRLLEARKAAVVNPDLFLGVRSYSGFFTVNATYDSNMFFWYFPVEKRPANATPWIIWLQGGPGASSMTGLFDEIGPFRVNHRGELERNNDTWLQNHSLVFIENPVGTGYSYTNHKEGYARDMATYTAHLYSTVKQLLQVFPELRTAPLYVAGESYAGKYVPALGMAIHTNKDTPGGDINLWGLMIGNAYVEPSMLASVPTTFYNFGLLSQEQVDVVKPLNDLFLREIAANRSVEAKTKWHELVKALLMISHQEQAYNFMQDDPLLGIYVKFLQRSDVKRALHVGDIVHEFVNVTVNNELAPEFLDSARPMFETLLNHYKVLAYCGQLDMMLACPVSAAHYRAWQWDRAQEFRNATRTPFIFRRRVAAYQRTGGRLTEVVVRGAGHMAPKDAPGLMRLLVARWTHGFKLSEPRLFDADYRAREFIRNVTSSNYYN